MKVGSSRKKEHPHPGCGILSTCYPLCCAPLCGDCLLSLGPWTQVRNDCPQEQKHPETGKHSQTEP